MQDGRLGRWAGGSTNGRNGFLEPCGAARGSGRTACSRQLILLSTQVLGKEPRVTAFFTANVCSL